MEMLCLRNTPPEIRTDLTIQGAIGSALEEIIAQNPSTPKVLRLFANANVFSQTSAEYLEISVNGDEVFIGAAVYEAASTALISAAIVGLLGLTPLSAAAIGVSAVGAAAATSVYYSYVNDEAVVSFFEDVDNILQYLAGTTDVSVELTEENGNVLAYCLYNDGLGEKPPIEAARDLLLNLQSLSVSTESLDKNFVRVFEGERLEDRQEVASFKIFASEMTDRLIVALDGGDSQSFVSRHLSYIAEIDGSLYLLEDSIGNQPEELSGAILLPSGSEEFLPESFLSISPSDVIYTTANGKFGFDLIIGADGFNRQVFDGMQGADLIFGLDGNDLFKGGGNKDNELDGDVFFGGDLTDIGEIDLEDQGEDTADYSEYEVRGVALSLSTFANHSELVGQRAFAYWENEAYGKTDRLYSIENVIGTDLDDLVEGSALSNDLSLGAGDDIAIATEGEDVVDGEAGFDIVDYSYVDATITVETDDAAQGNHTVTKTYADGTSEVDQLLGVERIVHPEFRANTTTDEIQRQSSAAQIDGGFVVAWVSQKQVDGQSLSIVGRRFDANGNPLSTNGQSEFVVSEMVGTTAYETKVASLQDGGFVVVWQGRDEDSPGRPLKTFVRLYDSGGNPKTSELVVFENPQTDDVDFNRANFSIEQGGYDVAVLSDGNIAIVSQASSTSAGNPFDGTDIQLQVLSSQTGEPSIDDTIVNTGSQPGTQFAPSITALANTGAGSQSNGGFIVSWTEDDDSFSGVSAQFFDSGNATTGGIVQINQRSIFEVQGQSSLVGLRNGGYVAVWTDFGTEEGGSDIRLLHVGPNGAVIHNSLTVNADFLLGNQTEPTVTALADGGYIVSWTDGRPETDGGGSAIVAQQFDVLGQEVGDNFVVNVPNGAGQRWSDIAALPEGDFVITWTGSQGGDDVYYRLYTNRTADTVGPILNEIEGTEESDTLPGTDEADQITGLDGDDEISGDGGNDVIFGGPGKDVITGGPGNDEIDGGPDFDIAVFEFQFSDYKIANIGDAIEVVSLTSDEGTDTLLDIERLEFLDGFFEGGLFTPFEVENTPPVAQDDVFVGLEDVAITGNVLAENGNGADFDEDGDDLSIVAETLSTDAGGSVQLNADGSFTYTPATHFFGDDSFIYTLLDGRGGSTEGRVSLGLTGINDAPVADDEALEVADDGTLTVAAATLLDGDTDVDGDELMLSGVSNPLNGTVSLDDKGDEDASNDEVIFIPTPGYFGDASFDYTVSDGQGGTDTALVNVAVIEAPGRSEITTDDEDLFRWETRERVYDGDDELVQRITIFDDGRIIDDQFSDGVRTARATTDPANVASFERIGITYDESGRLAEKITIRDDGRIISDSYSDGVRSMRTISDPENAVSYESVLVTYDANGLQAEKTTTRDDGRVIVDTFDDGVRSMRTTSDPENAVSYDSIVVIYDENGLQAEKTTTYDDGRFAEDTYINGMRATRLITDTEDAFAYDRIEFLYDAEGSKTQKTTFFDDGRVVVRDFAPDPPFDEADIGLLSAAALAEDVFLFA